MDLILPGATVFLGDALARLRQVPDRSYQMCVTSPPYFGLRSYLDDDNPDKPLEIGAELTPDQFIAKLVTVFREVHRVLVDDGVLFVNIGDTYASAWPCNRRNVIGTGSLENGKRENRPPRMGGDLKDKDLIGIPWMLAFALRADGWYLRSEIIWHKPNPMPESVTDRPTKAHETLFLLSKQPKYFYDHEAVKEAAVGTSSGSSNSFKRDDSKRAVAHGNANMGTHRPDRPDVAYDGATRNRRSVWTIATRPYKGAHFAVFPPDLVEPCILAGSRPGDTVLDPFNGSGTTGQVALEHGRNYVGCELNAEYLPLTEARLSGVIAAIKAEQVKQAALDAEPKQLDLLAS